MPPFCLPTPLMAFLFVTILSFKHLCPPQRADYDSPGTFSASFRHLVLAGGVLYYQHFRDPFPNPLLIADTDYEMSYTFDDHLP
jgi:hypothetical protein